MHKFAAILISSKKDKRKEKTIGRLPSLIQFHRSIDSNGKQINFGADLRRLEASFFVKLSFSRWRITNNDYHN